MAQGLNKVFLIGHVGNDPEFRTTNNGNEVCNFRLATGKTWKDKQSGERKEKTEWHSIVVWNEHIIPTIEAFVIKGSRVGIIGELQTRKWEDNDGNDRYQTEVVMNAFGSELILLDGPRKDDDEDDDDRGRRNSKSSGSKNRNRDRDDDDRNERRSSSSNKKNERNSRSSDRDDRGNGKKGSRSTEEELNDEIPF